MVNQKLYWTWRYKGQGSTSGWNSLKTAVPLRSSPAALQKKIQKNQRLNSKKKTNEMFQIKKYQTDLAVIWRKRLHIGACNSDMGLFTPVVDIRTSLNLVSTPFLTIKEVSLQQPFFEFYMKGFKGLFDPKNPVWSTFFAIQTLAYFKINSEGLQIRV